MLNLSSNSKNNIMKTKLFYLALVIAVVGFNLQSCKKENDLKATRGSDVQFTGHRQPGGHGGPDGARPGHGGPEGENRLVGRQPHDP